jgi:nucleotide-binding universal stress UspA family protein
MRRVLVWVTPTGWEACVDAARELGDVTLLQVTDVGPEPGGLLGRHRPPRRSETVDDDLLDAAAERLGRDAERLSPPGKPEHAVVDAADDFDLLVLSRTNLRPGPHSIGHAARFVVDHARCPILLVWPGEPGTGGPPRV